MQNINFSFIFFKIAFYKFFIDILIRWYILNLVDCNIIVVVKKIYRKKFILLCMYIKIQFILFLWRYKRYFYFMIFTYFFLKLILLFLFWNIMYYVEQNILRQLVLLNFLILLVFILILIVSLLKMFFISSYFMVDFFVLRVVFVFFVCF